MVTHLYGILGVILDRTFGNIIRMLRVIRLPKEERGHLSWTFVGTLAVILAYGLIMMFSASYSSGYTNHGGNIYYFIKPQAIVAAVGFVVMLGVSLINYRALRYMFWTFYVITLALLVLALSGPRTQKILNEVKPDLVIGCGGYVSGPVVRAAAKRGIKTAIHEQNAFPGVTNKLLAKDVDVVLAASADAVEKLGAPEKTTVVGNPVRPEVLTADREAARRNLKAGDRTVILSFGGSLGADRINQVVADLCAWEKQQGANVLHLHATGSRGVELFDKLEKEKGFAPGENLVVTPYINNMPQLLAAADLVIARSGALTLAELEAVGRASILIPSPNVAENHQYYNALELQKAGAAVVIEEKNLTGEGLIETVQQLLAQPGKLAEMGANAKTLGNPHSLELITAKLLELVK